MMKFCAGALLFAIFAAPMPAAQGSVKIGVIDPIRVQSTSKWAGRLVLEVKRQHRKNVDLLRDLAKKIEKAEKDLKMWSPGSVERDRATLEVGVLRTRFKNMESMYQTWRDRRIAEVIVAVRTKIGEKAAFLAKRRGLALVLKKVSLPKDGKTSEKLMAVRNRIVLYAADELDLTDDVVKLIDADEPATGRAPNAKPEPAKKAATIREANSGGKRPLQPRK